MATSILQWKWIFVSILVFLAAQFALSLVFGFLGVVTLGIGFALFLIIKPVTFFAGGFVSGLLSRGITIVEPAIGAGTMTFLGGILDATWLLPRRISWVIGWSILAFVVALIGAFFGERAQGSVR